MNRFCSTSLWVNDVGIKPERWMGEGWPHFPIDFGSKNILKKRKEGYILLYSYIHIKFVHDPKEVCVCVCVGGGGCQLLDYSSFSCTFKEKLSCDNLWQKSMGQTHPKYLDKQMKKGYFPNRENHNPWFEGGGGGIDNFNFTAHYLILYPISLFPWF